MAIDFSASKMELQITSIVVHFYPVLLQRAVMDWGSAKRFVSLPPDGGCFGIFKPLKYWNSLATALIHHFVFQLCIRIVILEVWVINFDYSKNVHPITDEFRAKKKHLSPSYVCVERHPSWVLVYSCTECTSDIRLYKQLYLNTPASIP